MFCMSIWAERRKQTIIWGIIFLIFIAIAIAAWSVFNQPPTCNDGIKNQNELGVDCGGVCSLMCKDMAQVPVILWQRFFKVSEGVYTSAAMIQNPNLYAYAKDVPYMIRLYDDEGVTIFERSGYMTLYPKYNFPIIDPGIRTLQRIPVRMTFEFTGEPVWYRGSEQKNDLSITNDIIQNESTSPRISAIIRNDSNVTQKNVKVAVLVYDPDGNVMAVSQTIVDNVPAHGTNGLVFSWPFQFPSPILKKELIILPE